ncbi:MAG: hypothetical protein MZV64_26400 [Ignavibacteriales bacterium]|nr:hypothetical protein [Ignavibacteriales bacterium]
MSLKIVTVVNDFEIFNKTIKNNNFMNIHPIHVYDNSIENIGISKRYNNFINEYVKPDSDFWIIFCHQDFGFLKDPLPILKKLDKNCIYGPIGVICSGKNRISVSIKLKGLMNSFLKFKYKPNKKYFGQINQGKKNGAKFFKLGRYLITSKEVDSVDCCCLICHSSLIYKHNLSFDELLDFHLYSEDFSFNAKFNHNIATKAVQFKCKHLSQGIHHPLSFKKG